MGYNCFIKSELTWFIGVYYTLYNVKIELVIENIKFDLKMSLTFG